MFNQFDDERAALWFLLSKIKKLKLNTVLQLKDKVGDLSELFNLSRVSLKKLGLTHCCVDQILKPDWAGLDRQMDWLTQNQAHCIYYESAHYPALLKETDAAPMFLTAIGELSLLNTQQIAIVGSRKATEYGRRNSYRFAGEMSAAAWTITSGLAVGVDGMAHLGALDSGGPTIAVIGTGLARCYPAAHQELAGRIKEQGLIISEFDYDAQPLPYHFPRRNRIISGLAKGVIVIEAKLKSGFLITARLALEQNREVFAVPGPINNDNSSGCHALINQGAKLVVNTLDILEELPHLERRTPEANYENKTINQQDSENSLNDNYQKVYDCISDSMTTVDEVIEKTGLLSKIITSILMILELRKYIIAVPGGYIRAKELQYERTSA